MVTKVLRSSGEPPGDGLFASFIVVVRPETTVVGSPPRMIRSRLRLRMAGASRLLLTAL